MIAPVAVPALPLDSESAHSTPGEPGVGCRDSESGGGGEARSGGGTVTVQPLAWTDLAELARLETTLFADDAWSEPTWWAELAARPRRDYVVATADDGTVVGYAGLDHGGDVADVMTVAVAPQARGTGLGDRLVDELVDRAAAHGAEAVMLEVRADNAPALRLYERHGFARLSVRRRYYQPGDVDAVVMRLLLDRRTS